MEAESFMRRDYLTSVAIGLALVALGARAEARTLDVSIWSEPARATAVQESDGLLRLADASDANDDGSAGGSDDGADGGADADGTDDGGNGGDGATDDGSGDAGGTGDSSEDGSDGGSGDGSGDADNAPPDNGSSPDDGVISIDDPIDAPSDTPADGPSVPDVVVDDPMPGDLVDPELGEVQTMTGGAQVDMTTTGVASGPISGDEAQAHRNGAAADWGREGCKSFFERGNCK